MKTLPLRFWFVNKSLLLCFLLLASQPTTAQIIPDTTLPNNSVVIQQGNTSIIEGGTQAGGNLFHSFQEFSVPTGGTAFFNNGLDVQNILSRVTGSSISNIDGLIRVNGTANLFLINPNGIIFGPNAQLNIGGSFVATTANSIKFADGTFYSTTNSQSAPLLTISVPVGLQMGSNPGNIVVQGPGHNLSFDPKTGATIRDNRTVGLQVAPGRTLALLGGNVALEGGNLTAEGGRIELGSVGGDTLVALTLMNQGMALSYPEIENFQDINLSKAASVDASGAGGGDIFVAGRRITLTDGSVILALTEGDKAGGTLNINASELLEVIGTAPNGQFPSGSFAEVQPGASGDGGNVTIETARLRLANGAQISATTFGSGKAGNLTVKATDTVEMVGTSTDGLFPSALATATVVANGDGGNLTIETTRLRISDGGQVLVGTFGAGKAGNLTVKATNIVELIGASADGNLTSGLFASVQSEAPGIGGNVTIKTAQLRVADGARVTVRGRGAGKAGNLRVVADSIRLENSSNLIADTKAGGGSIELSSPSIILRRGSSITTNATGGESGGNIDIQTGFLQLRDRSSITTNAAGEEVKGGNITIDSDVLAALENSDISANSDNFFGGRVQINSQGIFGTQFRDRPTPESDITASSDAGTQFSGTVTINTPDVDPSSGLVQLPETLVDAGNQIAKGCTATGVNQLAVAGRGGLPPNPSEALSDNAVWFDFVTPTSSHQQSRGETRSLRTQHVSLSREIVEAQGWVINSKGEVILTAEAARVTPRHLPLSAPTCQASF